MNPGTIILLINFGFIGVLFEFKVQCIFLLNSNIKLFYLNHSKDSLSLHGSITSSFSFTVSASLQGSNALHGSLHLLQSILTSSVL